MHFALFHWQNPETHLVLTHFSEFESNKPQTVGLSLNTQKHFETWNYILELFHFSWRTYDFSIILECTLSKNVAAFRLIILDEPHTGLGIIMEQENFKIILLFKWLKILKLF